MHIPLTKIISTFNHVYRPLLILNTDKLTAISGSYLLVLAITMLFLKLSE